MFPYSSVYFENVNC